MAEESLLQDVQKTFSDLGIDVKDYQVNFDSEDSDRFQKRSRMTSLIRNSLFCKTSFGTCQLANTADTLLLAGPVFSCTLLCSMLPPVTVPVLIAGRGKIH